MLLLLAALQAAPDSIPVVTLREALQRAAGLDPFYVSAVGQVDNAVWARRNAFAVFLLPAITGDANARRTSPPSFFFTDTLLRVPTLWSAQLTARYDLFTGGQKLAELGRSAAALEGARANELLQRFETAFFTESDYYDVLEGQELARVARERVRRAETQLGVARARVVSGAAVQTDSLELRLELTRARVDLLARESALRIARLQLGRRIGTAGPVDAVPLDSAAMPELPIALTDAITQAAQEGPQYRIAAANERAARASYRAQLGAYLPRLSVTFNANALDTEFFPNAFKQTTLQFTASFPLWDNGQRELSLSRARVNRDVARAVWEDMDRAVQRDVTAAYDLYATARATAELAQTGLNVARENYRVQQSRYSSGATDIVDLLRAQEGLSGAEVQLVQARYTTRLALTGVEVILGRRLFSDKDTP
jgi:outer membrane protein TolC